MRYVDDTLAAVKDIATCYGFLDNIKRSTPGNQLHDGSCKQQQITFHRNGAHKDWETVGNMCLQENDK